MSHALYRIDIAVTLESPYLVHGSDPGRYGLDATLLRDHRGRPVLPGTLLAGRIVEAWHNHGALLGNASADGWFGSGGVNGVEPSARRARIATADLVLSGIAIDGQPAEAQPGDIARIRQNDTTGAVESGALLLIEQIAAPGAQLTFKGAWHCWAGADEMALLIPQIRAALLLQTQLGAYRSVGFGRIRGCDVAAQAAPATPLALDTTADRQRFALRGDAPLCVGTRNRRGNVFESDEVISGGTILGAIAGMHAASHGATDINALDTPLARHFSRLRCTHALPSNLGNGRPIPLPQSLVSFKENDQTVYRDAYRHSEPPADLKAIPAFQTDWKEEPDLGQNWGATHRHLRVRTDIDGDGKAKETALFAYECVAAPLDSDGNPQTQWLFDLDLAGIPPTERPVIRQTLAELLGHGLFPLGKTDASLEVLPIRADDPAAAAVWKSGSEKLSTGQLVPLVLVSDALLFPTNAIADKENLDLAALYRAGFEELIAAQGASGALILSHHFARQRLAGGVYMQRRFQQGRAYQPWVLSEAGSVFVFKIADPARGQAFLQSWQAHGLPLPESVRKACGATWRDHPYHPQNGYGEVAIAPQHHIDEL